MPTINWKLSVSLMITLITSNCYSQSESMSSAEFEAESNAIFSSLSTNGIPKEAFDKAYVAFNSLRAQGALSRKPIITFVNFSIPSNRERMFVVDLEKRSVIYKTHVTHGKNSGGQGGAATNFSNQEGSSKSSLGFYLGSEKYSGKFGTSLRLDGISGSLNNQVRNRAIVMHQAWYAGVGGRSLGCLAVTKDAILPMIELVKNKTLIYAFTSSNFASLGSKNEAIIASKDKNYEQVADVSNAGSELSDFESLPISKAVPAIGIAGAAAAGVTLLKGTDKYETCQNLSNKSWSETTREINSGKDPSSLFSGSWGLLKNKIIENEVDNDEAVVMAQNQLTDINDCVAVAHTSSQTNFEKENINSPDSKTSSDGKIKCVYSTPESQDYTTCVQSIAAYEALNLKEKAIHAEQEVDYKTTSQELNNKVTIENAQSMTLDNAKKLQENHSNVAFARAEISAEKLNFLQAVSSKIPTRDSLYDECKNKFNKHGVVSTSEYTEFVKMVSPTPVAFNPSADHCMNAVVRDVKSIQNEVARTQIKEVLKGFGKEAKDYISKSNAILNQGTSSMDTGNSSLFSSSVVNSASTEGRNVMGGMGTGTYGDGISGDDSILNFGDGASVGKFGQNISSHISNYVQTGTKNNSESRELNFINDKDSNGQSNGTNNGIYNEDFNFKIKLALQDPSKLGGLNLTPEQMKEYLLRKEYIDSLSSKAVSRKVSNNKEKSNINEVITFHSKELNIFEIISARYKEVYRER